MASHEALRHLTIGQYIPADSPIHRLDPRAKLLAAGGLIIAGVVASKYSNVLFLALLVAVLVKVAGLRLRSALANLVPVMPVLLVMALLQILFYGGASRSAGPNRLLVEWGLLHISAESVRVIVVTWARFVALFLLITLLTSTTTASALTRGLEGLLRPLDRLHLPGHEIALVGAIALRFLPILGEQLEAILQAQASRGVSESRSRWHLLANARRMAQVIVPLFVDAYHRAEELILAMQARCYHGGKGRTYLIPFRSRPADYVAVILSISLAVLAGVLQYSTLP
jgi:energy-coupling factor transport system permease protein